MAKEYKAGGYVLPDANFSVETSEMYRANIMAQLLSIYSK